MKCLVCDKFFFGGSNPFLYVSETSAICSDNPICTSTYAKTQQEKKQHEIAIMCHECGRIRDENQLNYDNDLANKWDPMLVSQLKEQLAEQGKYEEEWLKRARERERPKTEEEKMSLERMHEHMLEICQKNLRKEKMSAALF